jgi:hypothetical protein
MNSFVPDGSMIKEVDVDEKKMPADLKRKQQDKRKKWQALGKKNPDKVYARGYYKRLKQTGHGAKDPKMGRKQGMKAQAGEFVPGGTMIDEKWAVGVVYHQDFGGGEISYFRADSLLKNGRWKGMAVDEYGGKQRKPKNITADEKVSGWETTPKNEIPKGLKEVYELGTDEYNNHGKTVTPGQTEASTFRDKMKDDDKKKKKGKGGIMPMSQKKTRWGSGGYGEKGGGEGVEEKKSATGYELYHKDFSSAMQHAYAHAKSKGFVIDPKEIDDKVATGPKKPSSGKVNRYSLKAGRKTVEIQVTNLDNKRYELNMYIEGVEYFNQWIKEAKDFWAVIDKAKGGEVMAISSDEKSL